MVILVYGDCSHIVRPIPVIKGSKQAIRKRDSVKSSSTKTINDYNLVHHTVTQRVRCCVTCTKELQTVSHQQADFQTKHKKVNLTLRCTRSQLRRRRNENLIH